MLWLSFTPSTRKLLSLNNLKLLKCALIVTNGSRKGNLISRLRFLIMLIIRPLLSTDYFQCVIIQSWISHSWKLWTLIVICFFFQCQTNEAFNMSNHHFLELLKFNFDVVVSWPPDDLLPWNCQNTRKTFNTISFWYSLSPPRPKNHLWKKCCI